MVLLLLGLRDSHCLAAPTPELHRAARLRRAVRPGGQFVFRRHRLELGLVSARAEREPRWASSAQATSALPARSCSSSSCRASSRSFRPPDTWRGWIPGGWRIVPLLYAVVAGADGRRDSLALSRTTIRKPGQGRPFAEMLAPLKYVQVWRFSLYYVVVFGAYVALSAWLPNYYVNTYQLGLPTAALLTALFIFPASLLRPLGRLAVGSLWPAHGHLRRVRRHDAGHRFRSACRTSVLHLSVPAFTHVIVRGGHRHGNRQGQRLQVHSQLLSQRRRRRRRSGGHARCAGRLRPAQGVRLAGT